MEEAKALSNWILKQIPKGAVIRFWLNLERPDNIDWKWIDVGDKASTYLENSTGLWAQGEPKNDTENSCAFAAVVRVHPDGMPRKNGTPRSAPRAFLTVTQFANTDRVTPLRNCHVWVESRPRQQQKSHSRLPMRQ